MVTKLDINMLSFANYSLTQNVYICFSTIQHGINIGPDNTKNQSSSAQEQEFLYVLY